MIVDNFLSSEGNKVANQFQIKMHDFHVFQSYKTIIAVKNMNTDQVILDRSSWDCSRTTSKYRVQFLGEVTQKTRAKINNGTYILQDLNKGKYCNTFKFLEDVKYYFLEHIAMSPNDPLVIPNKLSVLQTIKNDFLKEFEK